MLRDIPEEISYYDFSLAFGLAGVGVVYTEAARITKDKEWLNRLSWLYHLFNGMTMYDDEYNPYWNVRGDEQIDRSFLSGTAGLLYFLVRFQKLVKKGARGPGRISLI